MPKAEPRNFRSLIRDDKFKFIFGLTISIYIGISVIIWGILASYPAILQVLKSEVGSGKYNFLSVIALVFIISCFFVAAFATGFAETSNSTDKSERSLFSEIEKSERRLNADIERRIDSRIGEIVASSTIGNDHNLYKAIQEKIDAGLLGAVSDAVYRQADTLGRETRRWEHIENTFDRIRVRLDGPASRAEQTARLYQILAAVISLFGLCIACARLWSETGFVDKLFLAIAGNVEGSLWVILFAKAAPWVGVVLLAEFTALLFFRSYLRAIELQRYFTRELTMLEARFAGLRVVLDLGTPDQQFEIVKALIASESNILAGEIGSINSADVGNAATAIGGMLKDLKAGVTGLGSKE